MRQGYSKYAFASVFCTWAIMLVAVFLFSAWGKGVDTPEFWLLVAMSAGLLWFAQAMVSIMWSPLDDVPAFRNMLEQLHRPLLVQILENETAPSERTLQRYLDAAWQSGNLSANLDNPKSWIRTYFRLLNEELSTPPFPRSV